MDLKDWVTIAASTAGTVAALFAGLRFIVKAYLRELLPNGGASLADRIRRIEDTQLEMMVLLNKGLKLAPSRRVANATKKKKIR